jgi:hypothetical protein
VDVVEAVLGLGHDENQENVSPPPHRGEEEERPRTWRELIMGSDEEMDATQQQLRE